MVFLGLDDATLKLDGLWPDEIATSSALKLISQGKGAWNWSREISFHTSLEAYNGRAPQPGDMVCSSLVARVLGQLGHADLIPSDGQPRKFRYSDLRHGADYDPHPPWEVFSDATWKQNYQDGALFKDKIVMVGAAAPRSMISSPPRTEKSRDRRSTCKHWRRRWAGIT